MSVICVSGGSGKNIWGGVWPLIIWEATTAKRNYYITNYKLGVGKIWGACAPWPQHRTATDFCST